jgi:signal transduction histidine kinase
MRGVSHFYLTNINPILQIIYLYSFDKPPNRMPLSARFRFLFLFCNVFWIGELAGQPTTPPSQPVIPIAKNGILDLRKIDLTRDIIPLDGEWAIYWHRLLQPADTAAVPTAYTTFPRLWGRTKIDGRQLPGQGYASYTLTVLMPRHLNELAIQVPDVYTSYRLFINGKDVSSDGRPDTTEELTMPQYSLKVAVLGIRADTLRFLLQVANFAHSKGGPYKSILLGDKEKVLHLRRVDDSFDILLTGCLLMTSLIFFGLFVYGRRDKSILYFSLFALTYTYRVIGARTFVLQSIFPDLSWSVGMHLEYFSLLFSIIFFSLYTKALYPQETNKHLIRIQLGLCMTLVAIVAIFPTIVYTRLLNVFLVIMFGMILYAFFVYLKAQRNKRVGAVFALLSTGVLLVIFVILILQYFSIIEAPRVTLFIGYMSFFFLQSLILLFRFTHALKHAIEEVESKRQDIEKANGVLKKSLDELNATQQQLIQSEKMASLGELTAGIAHEIQNPLNFVNNFSELNVELSGELKDELSNISANPEEKARLGELVDDMIENQEKINFHGKRAGSIVKSMLQHSRSSTGHKEYTDINVLADENLRLSFHGLRAKDRAFDATIQKDFDPSLDKINIIPQDIGRAMLNLLTNAFYSVTAKSKLLGEGYEPIVLVRTRKMVSASGTRGIEIRIRDNGMGIPEKVVEKIFQPFFTTKPTGQGTGLGLSLSYDIVTKGHAGQIRVMTVEGEYAEFIIFLPA